MAAVSCSTFPNKQYSQFTLPLKPLIKKDKYTEITLSNPLKCPLRFYLSSDNRQLNKYFEKANPFTVGSQTDTIIKISHIYGNVSTTRLYCSMGDPNKKIVERPLSLPFPKGKEYKIIQAYKGFYSHNDNYSQYAIDIDLKQKDTVCAADDGFVVGVIKDYKYGGRDIKWKNYANFITLYHPVTGYYTQYVHLHHKGSFVKIGEFVKKGQPIGLSGMTGWTTEEHLHFNVLIPVEDTDGLTGQPVTFEENYKGPDLIPGDIVKK